MPDMKNLIESIKTLDDFLSFLKALYQYFNDNPESSGKRYSAQDYP